MKTTCTFYFILLLAISNQGLYAQTDFVKVWDARYGGDNIEVLTSFERTGDGGFILGGYSSSGISGNKTEAGRGGADYWIVKLDASGNLQWEKTYGGTADDFCYTVKPTRDGGYLIGGQSFSDSSADKTVNSFGGSDYWIIKTDSLGQYQWDNVYGGSDNEVLYNVLSVDGFNYALAGYSYSGSSGNKTDTCFGMKDFWILEIDSAGNIIWDKTFGGTGDDWLTDINSTSDKGFIAGGFSDSDSSGTKTNFSKGFYDYYIIKLDSNGMLQWDKDFGGTFIDGLYNVIQTYDGGYLMGGTSISQAGGDKTDPIWGLYDFWLIRTDSAGNKLWDKDLGGTENEEVFGSLTQLPDSAFLIAGCSYSNISGNKTELNLGAEQVWMLKVDDSGNKIWDKTIFSLGHDETGMAMYIPDSGYAIASYSSAGVGGYKSQPPWNGSDDYWIIKLADSSFYAGVNDFQNNAFDFSIFPNPNSGNFFLTTETFTGSYHTMIRIMDVNGRIVFSQMQDVTHPHIHCNLNDGLYVAEWINGNSISRKKFIVLNRD